MPIKKRDLRRCFLQKFGFEEVAGSRHEAVALIIGGRKVATTRFSRGHREIGDKVLTMIAREIGVPLGYLKRMHDCTRDRSEYLSHLRNTGRLA